MTEREKHLDYLKWCRKMETLMGILILIAILLLVFFLYRDTMLIINQDKVGTRNVLPLNKDKELKDPKEVRQYVGAMAQARGLSVTKVDTVISCESKFNIYARNRTSTAKGLAQFLDGTWRNNCKGDVFNAQHNTRCFMDNFKKYPSWWEQCV